MADEPGTDLKAPAKEADAKPTIKLAGKADPPTFAEKDQPDAKINVGMDHVIYVPSLEAQKAGFMPYRFDDNNQRIDATAELLAQYPGIYKLIA